VNVVSFVQASQCVGRIIRSKTDYGIMIFADCVCDRVCARFVCAYCVRCVCAYFVFVCILCVCVCIVYCRVCMLS